MRKKRYRKKFYSFNYFSKSVIFKKNTYKYKVGKRLRNKLKILSLSLLIRKVKKKHKRVISLMLKSIKLRHQQNSFIKLKITDLKTKKNNKFYNKWSNIPYLKTNVTCLYKTNLVSKMNSLLKSKIKLNKIKKILNFLFIENKNLKSIKKKQQNSTMFNLFYFNKLISKRFIYFKINTRFNFKKDKIQFKKKYIIDTFNDINLKKKTYKRLKFNLLICKKKKKISSFKNTDFILQQFLFIKALKKKIRNITLLLEKKKKTKKNQKLKKINLKLIQLKSIKDIYNNYKKCLKSKNFLLKNSLFKLLKEIIRLKKLKVNKNFKLKKKLTNIKKKYKKLNRIYYNTQRKQMVSILKKEKKKMCYRKKIIKFQLKLCSNVFKFNKKHKKIRLFLLLKRKKLIMMLFKTVTQLKKSRKIIKNILKFEKVNCLKRRIKQKKLKEKKNEKKKYIIIKHKKFIKSLKQKKLKEKKNTKKSKIKKALYVRVLHL
jgi:hypothetical protein